MENKDLNLEDYRTIKEMGDLCRRSPRTIRRYIDNNIFSNVIKTPGTVLIHKNEIRKVYKHLNQESVN